MHRTVLVAAPLVFAVALATPWPAGSDDTTPDTTVVFTNEGDPTQRILLPPPMEVGRMRITDSATSTGTLRLQGNQDVDTQIDVATESLRLFDVVSVAEDGSYTANVTFEAFDIEVRQGSPFAEELATNRDFGALEGSTLVGEFSPTGDAEVLTAPPGTTLTPQQEAAVDSILGADTGLLTSLPDEPIGLGAEWTADVHYAGAFVDGEFALSTLAKGEYVVDFSVAIDSTDLAAVDLPGRFQTASGRIAFTGTLSGDAKDPFTARREGNVDFVVTYTGPDGELTLDIESTITQVVEPA